MADAKISALTADTAPLNADVLPWVDTANTTTKKITYANLLKLGVGIFNVKAYGAVGNDSTDDTAAIQAAVDAANTAGGGIVFFPQGVYKIQTNPIKLYSGTTPSIVGYSSITMMGVGTSAAGSTTGSCIKQYTTGVDVIKSLNDAANGAQALSNTIMDLTVMFGGATLTNSGNGIYLAQQAASGPSFQGWNIQNVTAINCQGSGKYGFNFESIITSAVVNCETNSCANGFYANGQSGGAFNSVCTAVTFTNCYANMSTNGLIGFNCQDNTYMTYQSCAVDYGVNSAGAAYKVGGSSAISYYGCGCELASVTLTNMWLIGGDAASNASNGVGIYNCYSFQSKSCIDIYVTAASTQVTIIGHSDNSTISGSTGLKIDAGAQATEIDCNWGAVATPHTLATTAIWNTPGVPRVQTIASSATPSINVGITDVANCLAQASGTNVTSFTTNLTGTPVAGQHLHIALQAASGTPTITWGTSFEASTVALPTGFTTTRVDCDFIWNAATSKWRILEKI